ERSKSTLRARLNGTANQYTAHQHRKKLSIRQQGFLERDAQGFPPTHACTREMATRILRMNGDNQEFGNKFVTKFIRDNPRIASVIGGPIEAARIDGTNPEAILEFYTLSEDIIGRSRIQPCNTWNMNGYGIAVGVCINTRVLASSKTRRSYVKSPGSRECLSIIEVVSPTGEPTRPLVILKGSTFIPRLLRVGWKVAGIYPFEPLKGLSCSQVQASKPRPSTPQLQQEINPVFITPKSSRLIDQATKSTRKKTGEKQALYQALHKAGHAIDTLNASYVALEHRNTQLQSQLDQLTTKRRRKVPVNPNTQFANIDNIIMAKQAQAVLEAQEAAKQVRYDVTAAAREV
ncbi:hypothetical protein D6C86_10555, partial [Aureobasidium pullulans]